MTNHFPFSRQVGFRALLSVFFFVGLIFSAEPSNATELKVLTWNIQLLPAFVGPETRSHIRARKIADRINQLDSENDYDVIVFQEAFDHSAYLPVKRRLKEKYPYQFGPANRRYVTPIINSGVMILSKLPSKKLKEIIFKNKDGYDNKLARKGALLIEVEKEGMKFQILGTHLNAGGNPYIRLHQMIDIKDLVTQFKKAGVPQIAAGDFNITKDTDLYHEAMHILKFEDGPITGNWQYSIDWEVNDYYRLYNDGKDKKTLDYLFYDGNGLSPKTATRIIPDLRLKGWNPRIPGIENLSDHLPVALTLQY